MLNFEQLAIDRGTVLCDLAGGSRNAVNAMCQRLLGKALEDGFVDAAVQPRQADERTAHRRVPHAVHVGRRAAPSAHLQHRIGGRRWCRFERGDRHSRCDGAARIYPPQVDMGILVFLQRQSDAFHHFQLLRVGEITRRGPIVTDVGLEIVLRPETDPFLYVLQQLVYNFGKGFERVGYGTERKEIL